MHNLPPWLVPAPAQTKQLLITPEQIAAAFGVWQAEFDRAPQQFLTDSEMIRTNLVSLAEQRGDTFCAYLWQVSA